MLKKLWCFIWGHKIVAKEYTGKTFTTEFGVGHYYVYRKRDFCLRCGKKQG